MTANTMIEVHSELLIAANGTQIAREYNTRTPNGNSVSGHWVLRDVNGIFIDFDQYRHDLMERNGFRPNY